jgi:drug/metabolite transporter (DMT)-like permease
LQSEEQVRERGRTGLGLALLSAAAFGTSGAFAASLLAAGWTPGAAVTIRVVIAALVLTPAALLTLRGRYGLLLREARTVAVYGCAAVAGCQLAYFNAVEHLSVAVALLLEYSGALLVVGWLWLRNGQRPRRLTVAGALGSVAGLALVLELTSGADVDLVGVLWGLGAAVGLAVYFVLSAGGDEEPGDALPPLVVAWGGLAVGGAVLLAAAAVGLLPMSAPRTDVVLLDVQVSWLVPVLGLSVVAAALAYVTGIVAARLLGAKVASFVGLTEVLFAVAVAWLLLGQELSAVQLAGGALVVAGIALVRLDEGRGEVPGALVAADEGLLATGSASR